MSEPASSPQRTDGVQQVLQWTRCHPGTLIVGSPAVAAPLAGDTLGPEAEAALPVQTPTDLVAGKTPLFIKARSLSSRRPRPLEHSPHGGQPWPHEG